MATVNYPKTSPYYGSQQTSWYLWLWNSRTIKAASDDQLVTLDVRHEFKPELLSQELYGTPVYWWVFYVRNIDIIRDPIWDFVSGTTLLAPSLQYIKKVIG